MNEPIFIGDELTGAGFRLAGIRVVEAAADTVESVFRRALDDAQLVILTAGVATDLPADLVGRPVDADPLAHQPEPSSSNGSSRIVSS